MSIGFPAYHIQRLNLRDTNLRASVSAALGQTGWTVLETTKHSIRAKIGINLWTFGETIQITFIDDETIEIHSKCRLPQMFDWGKNKRNVNTLVNLIEGRCRSYNPKPKKTDVKDAEISTMKIEKKNPDSPLVSDKEENDTESEKVPDVEADSSMSELEKLIERRNVGEVTSGEFEEMKKEILERKPQYSKEPVEIAQEEVHTDDVPRKENKDDVVSKSNIGASDDDKFAKLDRLAEIKEKGLIDDDEFKQMKKEILGK